MDYDVELQFQALCKRLEQEHGPGLDVTSILFLIGINELGLGGRKFSKQEKTELMHVALCSILAPYGYYEFEGRDEDYWPHFKLLKPLPNLEHREQQHLIKDAIVSYFIHSGVFSPYSDAI